MGKKFGWRGVNGRPVKRQSAKARKPLIDLLIEAADKLDLLKDKGYEVIEFEGMPVRYGAIKTDLLAGNAVTDANFATAAEIEARKKEWFEQASRLLGLPSGITLDIPAPEPPKPEPCPHRYIKFRWTYNDRQEVDSVDAYCDGCERDVGAEMELKVERPAFGRGARAVLKDGRACEIMP